MFDSAIDPVHDLRHTADADPAYNESTYYNFSCQTAGAVSGWLRVGIQANQNTAQATICLFLPDGRIAFAYSRGAAPAPDEFCAGPLSISIVTPHEEQTTYYRGPVSVLSDGRAMVNPKRAFSSAPSSPCTVNLQVVGRGAALGHDGSDQSKATDLTMALGHYQQFIRVEGSLSLGDESWQISGAGLRDHSWGPRDWAGPLYYRWITAAFDDGSAVMGMQLGNRGGTTHAKGLVLSGGQTTEAQLSSLIVDWTLDYYQRAVAMSLESPLGTLTVTGESNDGQWIPLRHRRQDADGSESVTRIAYAPFVFRCDGRFGTGFVEALDQIVDGRPIPAAQPQLSPIS
ncbi:MULTISPECIES: hypothetical protein [unclassified Mycobacterium]|uniref:DUF7064 domain-containing protein n=1 Tax=unclassified Mycobacterium TaxID=2642494 RepID=UPI00073FB583|nr:MULTISPECIES: hypothetical protein [unclassified Mycobacterium]KUH87739.1 hypothetical protein AU185_04660 [Mycobacterium sp. GA-0227b]KUH87786.1 hypothetical protein AU186_03645 [Mycobacterium sp. GA-1999]KUH88678.1 hypothetical protein AU187_06995 [Mycobacterium sp. IS-1556]